MSLTFNMLLEKIQKQLSRYTFTSMKSFDMYLRELIDIELTTISSDDIQDIFAQKVYDEVVANLSWEGPK